MTAPRLARFYQQLHCQTFSYSQLEITKSTSAAMGYHLDQYQVKVGSGQLAFNQAIAALKSWTAHQSYWINTFPTNVPIEVGQNIIIAVGINGFQLLSGCRIVYTINEPKVFGFAYGTLQQHPAIGEERFLLEWLEDESVIFSLYAVSKPSNWFYSLVVPITRKIQFWASQTYLQAMYKAVNP